MKRYTVRVQSQGLRWDVLKKPDRAPERLGIAATGILASIEESIIRALRKTELEIDPFDFNNPSDRGLAALWLFQHEEYGERP